LVSDWSSDVCSSDLYTELFRKVPFDVFYAAFSQSYNQVTAQRRADLKEIPSQERFKVMLGLLDHGAHEITEDAIETITKAHMARSEERRVGKEVNVG